LHQPINTQNRLADTSTQTVRRILPFKPKKHLSPNNNKGHSALRATPSLKNNKTAKRIKKATI
jgi:hypothetical protein